MSVELTFQCDFTTMANVERARIIVEIALVVGILILGAMAWAQHSALVEMEEAMALIDARVVAVEAGRPATPSKASDPTTTVADDPTVVAVVPTLTRGATLGHPAATPAPAVVPFDPSNPQVRNQLREVIAEEQELLDQERSQQRSQRREERLREQVAELGNRAKMDNVTTEQLTDLLVVEQAEAMEIFRQSREDSSWEDARTKVASLRLETDTKAKQLLEDEEYAEYEKMREEEVSRWGGRGGRGDRNPTRGKGGTE